MQSSVHNSLQEKFAPFSADTDLKGEAVKIVAMLCKCCMCNVVHLQYRKNVVCAAFVSQQRRDDT